MITFTSSSGRVIELEITHMNIRTPPEPDEREFSASATVVENVAHINIGSSHSDSTNPVEIYRSIKEALSSLGFSMEYRRAATK